MITPKKRIFITGASGFLGSYLCRYFSERNFHVIALQGQSNKNWRLEGCDVERVSFNLTSFEDLRTFLRNEKPEIVLNCAAFGAYSNQTDPDRIYRVNFEAVRVMLETLSANQNLEAFIQAGSSSEYGANCTAPAETEATIPDSDYAVSKVAASALVQYYGKKKGLPAWTFRLYSVYGPWEDPTRLIPKLLAHVQEKKLPPLVSPTISRDFIYVEDVARAYEAVIEKADTLTKGGIFNIGTGVKTTLADLVECTRRTFRLAAEPNWGSMPARHWDHPDWYANPEKSRKNLGWSALTSLPIGLDRTLEWMNNNRAVFEEGLRNSVLGDTKIK